MKSRILTLLAMVMVAVGAFGLSNILQQQQKDQVVTKPVNDHQPEQIKLWYTKLPLTQGQEVTRDHLAIKNIDINEAHYQGFDQDIELKIRPGMIARRDISQERYVSQDDFIAPDQDGFVDLTIRDGYVPFPMVVPPDSIVGGIINHSTEVDIVALSSTDNNLARNSEVGNSDKTLELRPILVSIPVLQVIEQQATENKARKVNLILELTRNQVAKLTIAKQLASLEVHKSIGEDGASMLRANSGDVLPNFRSVTEFRAEKTVIK